MKKGMPGSFLTLINAETFCFSPEPSVLMVPVRDSPNSPRSLHYAAAPLSMLSAGKTRNSGNTASPRGGDSELDRKGSYVSERAID